MGFIRFQIVPELFRKLGKLNILYSTQLKKDYKRVKKQGKDYGA